MRKALLMSALVAAGLMMGNAAYANHHEKDGKMTKPADSADANHHGQEHKMMKKGDATDPNHHGQEHKMMKPAVATGGKTVMVNGKEFTICTKTIQDSCINPREAGLNWGNRPLDHWPGKPASEK